MQSSHQKAIQALQQKANEYVHFEIAGKKVKIPYVLGYGRWQFWNTSGKGTPEMIQKAFEIEARYHDFDIQKATVFEIYDFMRIHRIGIDCSGLAYHILNAYSFAFNQTSLATYLLRYPGIIGKLEKTILAYKRYRRISAKTLTSSLNSVEIYSVKNIRTGDLVRISRERDHVLVITGVTTQDDTVNEITYIHSSSGGTQQRGPHYGTIAIVDPEKGLESQEWLEKTKFNENYGKSFFLPERGDSVRRLKCLIINEK